jgi:chromosome segregation protein
LRAPGGAFHNYLSKIASAKHFVQPTGCLKRFLPKSSLPNSLTYAIAAIYCDIFLMGVMLFIERVEIFGFKSFARKIEVIMGPELCVVMGPNGCGKSNILDAIRWVIGEQRLSLLRSSALEDVIFKGSAATKPLNFAEVSIQFADARGILPFDPTNDTIRITRRTYRDGESEFIINGVQVRLKDIKSILSTVGLGDVGYAVIEQAMIERILGGSVEDRRMLFEQAAGVAKYKADKNAALTKLNATQEDLTRIDDILKEVEEQEAILKRQVAKAKRYKELLEKVKKTEIALAAGRLGGVIAERKSVDERIAALQGKISETSANIAQTRVKLQNLSESKTELETVRDKIVESAQNIDKKLSELEKENAVTSEKQKSTRNYIFSAKRSKEELAHKIEKSRADKAQLAQSLATFEEKLTFAIAKSKTLADEGTTVDKSLFALKTEKIDLDKRLLELRDKITDTVNKLHFQDVDIKKLENQMQSLAQQIATKRTELELHRTDQKSVSERVTATKSEIERVSTNLGEKKNERTTLLRSFETVSGELAETNQRRSEMVGRKSELDGIVLRGEDIGKETHNLLKSNTKFSFLGLVADMITVEPQFAQAAEKLFGEYAKFIAVENYADALEIAKNTNIKNGELGFVILSELESAKPPDWLQIRDDRLVSLISGATIDTTDSPETLSPVFTVSANGKYLRKKGVLKISIGEHKGAIAIRSLIRSLETDIAKLTAASAKLSGEKNALAAQIASIEREIVDGEKMQKSLQDRLNTEIRDLEYFNAGTTQLENAIATAKISLVETETALQNNREQQSVLHSRMTELDALKKTLTVKLEAIDSAHSQAEIARKKIDGQLSAVEIERIGTEGEIRHIKKDIEMAELTVKESGANMLSLDANIESAQNSLVGFERRIEQIREEIQISASDRQKVTVDLAKNRAEIDTAKMQLDAESKIEKDSLQKRDEFNAELGAHERRAAFLEASEAEIKSSALAELETEIEPSEPLDDDRQTQLRNDISNQKKRLEQSGAVNMEAEEQYDQVKSRLDFLSQQKADILESISDLKHTINRLDIEAKRLFSETFERCKIEFRKVFSELFEDGEADLELETPDEPLQSDILIKVKPAGKKQLTLSQLSAGEKALTSLALLMGLYLVKPSPFCLMDEVDAPLDDVNVERFLHLVRRFSEKIQFLIVSHNRRTLEKADYLYGVSMEKDGISKLVSIKMSDLKLKLE